MSEVDPAFHGAGQQAGLDAWRIENLKPVPVPAADIGRLHNGDSYIFLKTSQEKRCVRVLLAIPPSFQYQRTYPAMDVCTVLSPSPL